MRVPQQRQQQYCLVHGCKLWGDAVQIRPSETWLRVWMPVESSLSTQRNVVTSVLLTSSAIIPEQQEHLLCQ